MHKDVFCQKLFERALLNSIHKKRRTCLTRFVSSLLNYDIGLSITNIGRHLTSKTSIKHKIKAADYFAGNEGFAKDIPQIYQGLAKYFWEGYSKLVILVDWSGACAPGYFVLQASVVGHGRSIPIYQEVHPQKQHETQHVHEQFLYHLKSIIPNNIEVTIITDAGFHRHWFETVRSLNWDFIGRVYSRYHYRLDNDTRWHSVNNVPFDRYNKSKYIGQIALGKTKRSLVGHLYTYRARLSGKAHKKNIYPSHEKSHSDSYRNGWVIFSSLKKSPNHLIRFYKKRMQIEQNFRDIKNERLGIGLRRNQSSSHTRIIMLYFLGTLLSILLWWFGLLVERSGEHRKYQVNTVRTKRVVSLINLGRMMLLQTKGKVPWRDFSKLKRQLQEQYFMFIEDGILI